MDKFDKAGTDTEAIDKLADVINAFRKNLKTMFMFHLKSIGKEDLAKEYENASLEDRT